MRVIPAIDLRGGRCVRLYQGDFARETEYSKEPISLAERFQALGALCLHVVDLDGARDGTPHNAAIVEDIARGVSLAVQLGGGIRDADSIQRWLDRGVARCVIGSAAVTCPSAVKSWIATFGAERIVLALDVCIGSDGMPRVATHGWSQVAEITLWECLDEYCEGDVRHVLCTDVSRDGARSGPNVDLYAEILERHPHIELQASGGVRDVADLRALREAGCPAAITGRALLEGTMTPEEVRSFQLVE